MLQATHASNWFGKLGRDGTVCEATAVAQPASKVAVQVRCKHIDGDSVSG